MVSTSGSRGIRNNNPGNIRHGSNWQGMSAEQTDLDFVQFDEMRYGIRALTKVLRNYERLHNLKSIRAIISRYAPTNENNTEAYIKSVADDLGVSSATYFSVTKSGKEFELIRAIIKHENGYVQAARVSDETIREGIALA